MKLSSFTFIVTDDCNFYCEYCPQKKEKKFISVDLIKRAIDFFYPLMENNASVGFYGGEPLLCFNAIREAVIYFKKKNFPAKPVDFSITTNGSLLNEEVLEFLNQNRFSVILSFDGFAHNISRKKDDFNSIVDLINNIRKCSQIELETNSVFTPGTVRYLAESIHFIIELGVKKIRYVLSTIEKWNEEALIEFESELEKVVNIIVTYYKKNGSIPVSNFKKKTPEKGLFTCTAGKDRMAITPDGKIWGCFQFHEYFKGKEKMNEYSKYFFGDLDYFIDHYKTIYPEILPNYADLRIDNFSTGKTYCFLCGDIEYCEVCPVYTAHSNSILGKIPAWVCKINKIKKKMKKDFLRKIQEK